MAEQLDYTVLQGEARDRAIEEWREAQRVESVMGVKEALTRLFYKVTFTEPDEFPHLFEQSRRRERARRRADWPITEVRRYENEDGSIRHRIIHTRNQPAPQNP